jgi:hypothetical protein
MHFSTGEVGFWQERLLNALQYPYILHSFIWTRNLDLRKKYKKRQTSNKIKYFKVRPGTPFLATKRLKKFLE